MQQLQIHLWKFLCSDLERKPKKTSRIPASVARTRLVLAVTYCLLRSLEKGKSFLKTSKKLAKTIKKLTKHSKNYKNLAKTSKNYQKTNKKIQNLAKTSKNLEKGKRMYKRH